MHPAPPLAPPLARPVHTQSHQPTNPDTTKINTQQHHHHHQNSPARPSRALIVKPVANSGKTDITKVGLNSIEDETIKSNLMGKSRVMKKKGWVDSQGRKGKGYGVYRVRFLELACGRVVAPFFRRFRRRRRRRNKPRTPGN
jgi:hypothetical protein